MLSARRNAPQLKPSWSDAAMTPKAWRTGMAGDHRAPRPKWMMSAAKSETPSPKGMPHMSARRLDFTKTSYTRSARSRTAQIAGYSVCVTMPSTPSLNAVIELDMPIAPACAKPHARVATSMRALPTASRPPYSTASGQENEK